MSAGPAFLSNLSLSIPRGPAVSRQTPAAVTATGARASGELSPGKGVQTGRIRKSSPLAAGPNPSVRQNQSQDDAGSGGSGSGQAGSATATAAGATGRRTSGGKAADVVVPKGLGALPTLTLTPGDGTSNGPMKSPRRGLRHDGTYVDGDFEIRTSGVYLRDKTLQANPEANAPPNIDFSQLEEVALIGRGGQGVVRKVRYVPTQQFMALKTVPIADSVADGVKSEILMELTALYNCASPHIVKFYGASHLRGRIQLAMEYMNAGSLAEILSTVGRIPEDVLSAITLRVLKAFHYLHVDRRIIHRDIKPSNILVNTAGEVKICDFGVSGQLANTLAMAQTRVGTVTYMSPERIRSQPHSASADIWSLGITLIELATGRFPYPPDVTNSPLQFWSLLRLVVNTDSPTLPEHFGFSPEFHSFVALCLDKDMEARPSVTELLWHPFICLDTNVSVDQEALLAKQTRLIRKWVATTDPLQREVTKIEAAILAKESKQRALARRGSHGRRRKDTSSGSVDSNKLSTLSAKRLSRSHIRVPSSGLSLPFVADANYVADARLLQEDGIRGEAVFLT
ncbi:STE/STE7/MEK1 protein kinase [Thecamonas trahens ATCC 50062]|uniref:mitogen-activated protein kinase kinase n=1 Tax=Thecamonas trahens ATCC 50062 TaxID=461836 RepID=A0A0L0D6E0_THETB|nr:STE/STE7/MEK1 protein kinase [Thecamonas trahens ATCC 50062]KNC47919.1 STE/STE7/MEK1 protein kinase [Thecamonas trahens ATCC 50062]|eukprot:XP_013758939.1 STE/STE7/MEK1 protein kinase [Thecamonas trahens ATCC 50062]